METRTAYRGPKAPPSNLHCRSGGASRPGGESRRRTGQNPKFDERVPRTARAVRWQLSPPRRRLRVEPFGCATRSFRSTASKHSDGSSADPGAPTRVQPRVATLSHASPPARCPRPQPDIDRRTDAAAAAASLASRLAAVQEYLIGASPSSRGLQCAVAMMIGSERRIRKRRRESAPYASADEIRGSPDVIRPGCGRMVE